MLYNPSMPLHRDILNMIGHANHAVALGNFLEGRVWIEDENGQATTVLETKNGQKLLHGTWIDMHDAPVTFNARISYAKRIAETCGLLQHIRLKRSSMLLLRTATSLSNLAFQFLSHSKHINCVNPSMSKPLRANSEPIPECRSTLLLVGFMMDRQSEQLIFLCVSNGCDSYSYINKIWSIDTNLKNFTPIYFI